MILPLCYGLILGIFIGSFIQVHLVVFIACVVLTGIFFIYRYSVEEKDRLLLTYITFLMLGVLLGIGRMSISNLYADSTLNAFALQKVSAVGTVVEEPDVRESSTKLTVLLSQVSINHATTTVSERVLVSVPLYPEYAYGDKVSMTVTLEQPQNIKSDDGRTFDYGGYLRVRDIWYVSKGNTYITLISHGNGNPINATLFKIKHYFTNALNMALPEPESSLMAGLLLGTKQSLGKDLLTEFSRAGVSHVVVLSGYNIAIVATSIMALLSFLPKTLSFGFGMVSIVLFTVLSGGGASAWRAAIMVLIALVAKRWNREYKVNRAFGFAIILMLTPNPLLLVFDPSFQLSVLATIGIIFVSPIVAPYFSKYPLRVTEKYGLREVISATVATQLTVLPFLIYTTGIVSLTSLPVNILILGTIPLTMLLGFFTGAFGLISLWPSFIPALPSYILLWYQLTVVHIGATLPFGVLTLPAFSPVILVLAYVGIFIFLYRLSKKV